MSSFATAHYIDIVVSIHVKIATINRQILLKTSFNHYQQNISERVINGQDEQIAKFKLFTKCSDVCTNKSSQHILRLPMLHSGVSSNCL